LLDAALAEFLEALVVGDGPAMGSLGTGAIHLQIAQDDQVPSAETEKNKGIGHEQAHGIEHVGAPLAVGDDQ
jgi:hypothetical protein